MIGSETEPAEFSPDTLHMFDAMSRESNLLERKRREWRDTKIEKCAKEENEEIQK